MLCAISIASRRLALRHVTGAKRLLGSKEQGKACQKDGSDEDHAQSLQSSRRSGKLFRLR
jgi:hypothetical protein